VLETSEANARQLASRARAHLQRERGAVVSGDARERLLAAFIAAAESGDVAQLAAMLSADAITVSDGGGVVRAARKVIGGRDRVAQFLHGVLEKLAYDLVPVPVSANGELAFVGLRDGVPAALWTLEGTTDGVTRVLIVLNPQKLSRFAGLSSPS
jgi:RNA polymerase sigma-70 factor, ECF subfamily